MASAVEGRTFANETYVLPNDTPEHERLETQSLAIYELMGNRTHLAPIQSPRRILDVGCGTGIITTSFARAFPDATVIGVDLSPVPNDLRAKPGNVTYLEGDIRDLAGKAPLEFGTFDFVYSRLLIAGMTHWQQYIDSAAKLLRPGGYLEIQDLSIRIFKDGVLYDQGVEHIHALIEAAKEKSLDYECGLHAAERMRDASLQDIQVTEYPWPCGMWLSRTKPEYEKISKQCMKYEPWVYRLGIERTLVKSGKYAEADIRRFHKELDDCIDREGTYRPFVVTVGRKP